MSPSLETNASEDYRRRAQAWLSANLVRLEDGNRSKADRALTPERVARARASFSAACLTVALPASLTPWHTVAKD